MADATGSKNSRSKDSRSKVEILKEQSQYLRYPLLEELATPAPNVSEDGYQLLKFSGVYQQDDRDLRKARRKEGKDRAYQFMVRSKLPGGVMTAEQYLVHDDLAGTYGNQTMRFTTRQGIQLHGVLKGDLKATIRQMNEALITTLAACGDVSRNVMGCPAPESDREHALITQACREIEKHLLPRSEAYAEIWLDGQRLTAEDLGIKTDAAADEVEPIYGKTYLPRKFKIGVAFPHDNCVDVFTQDIGIVPVLDGEHLCGYNILVGGGLGMSHTDADTFPRLADPLGFVEPDELVKVVEAIVTTQRDHGNRQSRKRARMKYLIHEWGIEKFRAEIERRMGHALAPWVDVGEFKVDLHLGWRAQGDGRYYLGLPIENGRIKDEGEVRLRSGLREVISRFKPGVRITPQHNLLLTDLEGADQEAIYALLRDYGIHLEDEVSKVRRFSIACPALPTCGLALAESERVMPSTVSSIESELEALGLANEDLSVRMTGCPNGCARPYTAELAFVGRSMDLYNVYVGGAFEGTRLAGLYAELVHRDELVATAKPLLTLWKRERREGERFGDFCHRQGLERLKTYGERSTAAV